MRRSIQPLIPDMNTVTHSIIAGVPKAATTSLFRYLSDHPDICPSRIKETNYLSRPISDIARAKDEYSRFFNKEKGNHRVLLEASPGYFLNARTFCQNYGELVENGKVIVVLREPIDLLKSFFKHRVNKTNELNPRTSFTAFLTAVIDEDTQSAVFSNNCVSKEEIIAQKKNGLYFDYLQIFYDMLGKKNLK